MKAGRVNADSTWRDVLEMARARRFSEKDVEEVGAGTSIVYKIKNADGTFSFAKAEETLGKNEMDEYLKDYEGMSVGWGADLAAHIRKLNREKMFLTDELWISVALEMKSASGNEKNPNHGADYVRAVVKNIHKLADAQKDKKMKKGLHILADTIEQYKPAEGMMTKSGDPIDVDAVKEDFFKYNAKRQLAYNMVHDKMNANIKGEEVVISNRNVSMSRLAEDLGMGEVIAKSETAVMEKDGKLMRFNIMEGAKGLAMADLEAKVKEMKEQHGVDVRLEYTSEAINQLTKMQILDLICGQVDRNTANYFAEYTIDPLHPEVWKITGITGIDNDLSFGEIPGDQLIEKGAGRAGALLNKTYNTTSIPFIEKEFWENIQAYTKDQAHMSQADLRTDREIDFMWERLEVVKAELYRLIEEGRIKVIPKAEMDEKGIPAIKEMKAKNLEIDKGFNMHIPWYYYDDKYIH